MGIINAKTKKINKENQKKITEWMDVHGSKDEK